MRKGWSKELGHHVLWGEAPWGYRLSKDRTSLVRDEREQRITAIVRHMHAQGLSMRKIIEELTAMGHLTRRGGPFAVHRIFEMIHGGMKAKNPSADQGRRRRSRAKDPS